jgi:hypothetical protein
LGLTRGELGVVLFLLAIIMAGGRLPRIADALDRAWSGVRRRDRGG